MASRKEYLDFILEQISELEEITYRAMMGEYIIYYRGKIVGGIYDDRLLVKPVKSAISLMPDANYELPYRKAVDKLTELLVAEGAIHAVRLKQKSKTRRKKKIAAAIYEYQADCDGEWGKISFDFESSTAEIIHLADWDTIKTNRFANKAVAYLLNCENEKLPKETMVAFEP